MVRTKEEELLNWSMSAAGTGQHFELFVAELSTKLLDGKQSRRIVSAVLCPLFVLWPVKVLAKQ